MADEKRILVLSLSNVRLGIGPDRQILMALDLAQSSEALGLQVDLAIDLSPAQARALATTLSNKADEAEAS